MGTPLGVFSTLANQSELDLLQLKVTSPKKGKSQLFPKSLFTSSIGHNNSCVIVDSGPSFKEPIISTKGTNSKTNSKTNSSVPILDEVLVDSMTISTAASGVVPGPAPTPVPTAGPDVPIVVQMGAVGDCTTSVVPLPTFNGWPSVNPDQHLFQFLTACIVNNGRIEDVWLRWLPATLKDTIFEWYNCQPVGSFPNWNALKEAFLLYFRPIGFEDRLREQLMHSHMIPGEIVKSYYGWVVDIIRRWPNNQLPKNFILLILINGLYPLELIMFVMENQLATIPLSLARAKVWEECHYDRILNLGSTLIPTLGTKFPNMNMAANSFQGLMLPTTNSNVAMQPVLNPIPL